MDKETKDELMSNYAKHRAMYIEAHHRAMYANLNTIVEQMQREDCPTIGFIAACMNERGHWWQIMGGAVPGQRAIPGMAGMIRFIWKVFVGRLRDRHAFMGDRLQVKEGKAEIGDKPIQPNFDRVQNARKVTRSYVETMRQYYSDVVPEDLISQLEIHATQKRDETKEPLPRPG